MSEDDSQQARPGAHDTTVLKVVSWPQPIQKKYITNADHTHCHIPLPSIAASRQDGTGERRTTSGHSHSPTLPSYDPPSTRPAASRKPNRNTTHIFTTNAATYPIAHEKTPQLALSRQTWQARPNVDPPSLPATHNPPNVFFWDLRGGIMPNLPGAGSRQPWRQCIQQGCPRLAHADPAGLGLAPVHPVGKTAGRMQVLRLCAVQVPQWAATDSPAAQLPENSRPGAVTHTAELYTSHVTVPMSK